MTPNVNDFGDEAERSVQNYLEKFLSETPPTTEIGRTFQRVVCCNSSRSLYCEECCRLLVQDDSLPISCRRRNHSERPLKLPFDLHVILDDCRKSATGLHAVALLNGTGDRDETSNYSCDLESVKLVDLEKDDVPRYIDDTCTYLLFPSPGESVPLESVERWWYWIASGRAGEFVDKMRDCHRCKRCIYRSHLNKATIGAGTMLVTAC